MSIVAVTTTATGLVALAGALVGGLLTSGTQLLVHRLSVKREAAARSRETLAAVRMLASDLADAWDNLTNALRTGTWWAAADPWRISDNDRRLVAEHLLTQDYRKVHRAERVIHHWYRTREAATAPTLDSAYQKDLRSALREIYEALETLRVWGVGQGRKLRKSRRIVHRNASHPNITRDGRTPT